MKIIQQFALIAAAGFVFTSSPLFAADTDERIESSFGNLYVTKAYFKEDAIKAESKNGVITLTGQVNEISHKHLAQEAAAGLPGVVKVENCLTVKLEGNEDSDAWIRAKVRSVLAFHQNVNGSATEVDIKDGVVTLRGEAASEAQKELTGEYAEDVKGVLRVTNVMTVVQAQPVWRRSVPPAIDDASINAQVRVALMSHKSTSATTTTVVTTNGVVTVSGIAKNPNEKTLVSKLATDIVGVKSCANNMTVAPQAQGN
jgi:osmotically-inducible protein OsmY